MELSTITVNERGLLMKNCIDVIYGIQYYEYQTMEDQVWFAWCPIYVYYKK